MDKKEKLESGGIQYGEYEYSASEKAKYLFIPSAVILVISILCYDNMLFSIMLLPYIPIYLKGKKKQLIDQRRWKLNMQFGECISCISTALEAGYSVENAVCEAYNDLKLTFSEQDLMMQEMMKVIINIRNNGTIEDSFNELAARSGVDDILSFAEIFATAKRTGGNIIKVIRSTSDVIHTRVELQRELKTIIASKKYEADIMKMVPVFMLAYLKLFSNEMVAALYGNLFGVVVMTVLLIVYLALCKLSDYLVKIEL